MISFHYLFPGEWNSEPDDGLDGFARHLDLGTTTERSERISGIRKIIFPVRLLLVLIFVICQRFFLTARKFKIEKRIAQLAVPHITKPFTKLSVRANHIP